MLVLLKNASDRMYFTANRESLEKDAEKVRQEAREVTDDENDREGMRRLEEMNRRKIPTVPVAEDSSLRAELRALSDAPVIRGRTINILLVGIDSRLSSRSARADAIHLFTINPDSAVVEIMSIPRDMYVDLGYPDTTSFNILANARAVGYPRFLEHVADVAERGSIRYYVEVGFSQAMGVLEILGYKDPAGTLRFLRNRRGHAAGDVQRSHNQAVFLRHNLIEKFSLLTGASGEIILSAGLAFVTTNMSKEFCRGLIYALAQRGFPRHRPDAVRLRMPSKYRFRLKDFQADSATIAQTNRRLDQLVGDDHAPRIHVASYLRRTCREAAADSNRPGLVIHSLGRLCEQHAWLQIPDRAERIGVRDTLMNLLQRAYRRVGKEEEARRIEEMRRAEDILIRADSNR
ncbi:MAG: LCP family protein [Bacteroidota bacterium]|nr:LCP family protein [Bacteroidota bacterium]